VGLDLVEFVMSVEAEFDVAIPDTEAATIITLGDLHAWLQAHFGQNTNDPHRTWLKIVELAVLQFDVAAESLTPETKFLDLAPYG
jgi:hypothetical protein